MAAKALPSLEILDKYLICDAEAGTLTWRERGADQFKDGKYSAKRRSAFWNGRFAGKPAMNATHKQGYKRGHFEGGTYLAHRVIFKMHHRREPGENVDHIDGDPSNNEISNLREITHSHNIRRSCDRVGNIRRDLRVKRANQFEAKINRDGKPIYLGYHPTREAAQRAINDYVEKHKIRYD